MTAGQFIVSLCLLLVSSTVFAGDAPTSEQKRGREIYRSGQMAGVAVGVAAIGADGMKLSSASFSCASCHGVFGKGGREGGIAMPPLNWQRLTAAAVSTVSGRRRGAYTRETLRLAIAAGLDPEHASLHESMPRFTMPDIRLSEVIAYLERIGDDEDTDPGVSPGTIRIGVALPLSGPLAAAGVSIRETLERVFAAASRDGGIYGRSIDLVVEDSRGESTGLRLATRRLVESDNVFALVASFTAGSGDEIGPLLEEFAIPLVGPVGLSPQPVGVPNPYVFYLMPGLYDQARALVDFIAARGGPEASPRPRLAVIYAGNAADQAVIEGLRRQAGVQGMEIVAEQEDAAHAVASVLAKRPNYLVYAGDGAGLQRVAAQLDRDDRDDRDSAPALAGFLSTAQSGVNDLPARVAARALFVAPAPPPDARQAAGFFSILPAGDALPTFAGLRAAAFASGTVLVEALRVTGGRLSRPGLVRTLERLQHFETGVTPPISFGPNRRNGNVGGVIFVFDPERRSVRVASDWITPKE